MVAPSPKVTDSSLAALENAFSPMNAFLPIVRDVRGEVNSYLNTFLPFSSDSTTLNARSLLSENAKSPISTLSPITTVSSLLRPNFFISSNTIVGSGFPIKIDDPSELGADLAANAAGAIAKVGFPAIVIDFGTATTISVIDETRAYIGAAIMPGVQMSLDSLQNTGLLPGIAADKTVPIIGKTTKDCMSAGVLRGQAFSAQSFAKAYREAYFPETSSNLVISGGFAEVMLPYIFEKFTYIPYLTLEGLNVIYKNNKVNPRKK